MISTFNGSRVVLPAQWQPSVGESQSQWNIPVTRSYGPETISVFDPTLFDPVNSPVSTWPGISNVTTWESTDPRDLT